MCLEFREEAMIQVRDKNLEVVSKELLLKTMRLGQLIKLRSEGRGQKFKN